MEKKRLDGELLLTPCKPCSCCSCVRSSMLLSCSRCKDLWRLCLCSFSARSSFSKPTLSKGEKCAGQCECVKQLIRKTTKMYTWAEIMKNKPSLDPWNWKASDLLRKAIFFIYLEIIPKVTQVLKVTFVSMKVRILLSCNAGLTLLRIKDSWTNCACVCVRVWVCVNLSVSRSVSCFCKASTFPSSSILMSLSDWSLCLLCCSEFCSLKCTKQ